MSWSGFPPKGADYCRFCNGKGWLAGTGGWPWYSGSHVESLRETIRDLRQRLAEASR